MLRESWLPDLDSNQGYMIQSHVCYRCTIGQCEIPSNPITGLGSRLGYAKIASAWRIRLVA